MSDLLVSPVAAFDRLPVIAGLQSLGLKFLGLALVTWLACEAFKAVRTGTCDLVTPCVRVLFAAVMLKALPAVGNGLFGLAVELSRAVGDENHQQVFASAITNVADSAVSSKVLKTMLGWVLMGAMVALTVVKMFIVDLLFPAMFGIVLVMGLLGIPLGAFPGINSFKGWFMALLEISLWPVCYQLVVAVLTSHWASMLEEVGKADFGNFFSGMMELARQDNVAEAFTSSRYFLLVQFLAFLALYMVLTLFSPAIAAVVMRSQPAGYVGGIMAAKASSGATKIAGKMFNRSGSSPFKSGIAESLGQLGANGKDSKDSLKDMNKRGGARAPQKKGAQ